MIVIDNALYHSRNSGSYPKSKWRKQQLIDWLKEKNVTIPDQALRAELTKSKGKSTHQKLSMKLQSGQGTQLFDCHGITANSILWNLLGLQRKILLLNLEENSEMKLDSVEKLFMKKRNRIPREFWANYVEHVKKVEQSYRESDKIQDVQVENLVIGLKGNDFSDSDSETSLSAEESDDNLHDI